MEQKKLQTNQYTYVCTFLDCKAAFSESWRLEAHLCKHTGLRPFSCENCGKSFGSLYQLTGHELSHGSERPHRCSAEGCSEAFVTSAGVKNHMARVHQHLEKKRYQCDHHGCEQEFNKRNKLKAHKFEHGDPSPFCCTFSGCTKEFPTQGKLKRHEKVHEGYPCGVELCPFWGRTWTEYLKHRGQHNAQTCERPQKKRSYLCTREGCDEKFSRLFRLKDHGLGDHEGKKPFSCPGCGESFAVKETLLQHRKEHNQAGRKKQPDVKTQAARITQSDAATEEGRNNLCAKLKSTALEENGSCGCVEH